MDNVEIKTRLISIDKQVVDRNIYTAFVLTNYRNIYMSGRSQKFEDIQ